MDVTTVFEEQNLSKAIMRVGLPAMLGQLTTLINNIADTFFVSMTREPAMIAAVTLCTPILLIVMSIGFIKESTIGLALGNSINIVFDFIFIVLWGWGTAGAALATSFGFFCSTVY